MNLRLIDDYDETGVTAGQGSSHAALVKILSDMGFNPDFIETAISYTASSNLSEILNFMIKGEQGWEHEFIRKH